MLSYVFEDEETKPKQRLSYAFEDEVAPPEPERPVFESPDPTGMLDYSGGVGPETETNVGAWLKAGGKGVAHALTSTAPAMVNAAARQFVDRSRSLDEAGASSLIDSDQEVETPEYTRAFTKNLSDKLGVGVDVWNAVGRPLELPASATKGEQRAFGVGESLGLVGAVIPFGAVGGPVALGIGTSGQKYDELIRSGVDPERAHKAALITGVAETVPELFSFRIGLSKKIPFLKKAIYGQVSELLGESATSATQLGADIWAMNPGKSREEIAAQYASEIGDTLTETVIQTMIQAPIQSAGMHGISRLDSAFQSRSEQAARKKYGPGRAGAQPLSATGETGPFAQPKGVEGQGKPARRIEDIIKRAETFSKPGGELYQGMEQAAPGEGPGFEEKPLPTDAAPLPDKHQANAVQAGTLRDMVRDNNPDVPEHVKGGLEAGKMTPDEARQLLNDGQSLASRENLPYPSVIDETAKVIDEFEKQSPEVSKAATPSAASPQGPEVKTPSVPPLKPKLPRGKASDIMPSMTPKKGAGDIPTEKNPVKPGSGERYRIAKMVNGEHGVFDRNTGELLASFPTKEKAIAYKTTKTSKAPKPQQYNETVIPIYRGEYSGNKGGNYYSPDKEWTRQFTQSGQDKEISELFIETAKIYRPNPLPIATSESEFDKAIKEAQEKGFAAVWFDEGKEEPNSIYVIDKKSLAKNKPTIKPQEAKPEGGKSNLPAEEDPRTMSDEQLAGEIEAISKVTEPLYAELSKISEDKIYESKGVLSQKYNELTGKLKPWNDRDTLLDFERIRRETEARNKASMGARDKRVAEASVYQNRNGWEIVKEGVDYVLRHPETKEDFYRGKLSRVREVADESKPDLQISDPSRSPKEGDQVRSKPATLPTTPKPKAIPFAPEKDFRRIIEETTSPLKEYLDKTPKAGLAIADISRLKKANDDIKLPEKINLQSVNPEVEGRWQGSKGLTRKGIITKSVEHLQDIWELRKPFPGLDYKKDAPVINILREFSAVPEYSKHVSAETTAGILAGLGPKKYDVFTRNIVLPDILRDIDRGLLTEDRLPFGYKNKSEIQNDYDKFKSIANSNPDIKASLARREKFTNELTKELVNQKLLPDEVLKDDRYFHHQVLQYMNMRRGVGTSSKDVRLHKKGFQKGRQGSNLDYNTEYVEAEFEWVSQAIAQLKTKEMINRIQQVADISAHVKSEAKKQGLSDWKKAIPEGYTIWQPKPGTTWYKTMSVPEKVLEEVLAGNRELTKADLTTVLAKGYVKNEWVVRERVARTLDTFRDFSKDEGFDHFTRAVMASWKQWVLLNPVRVLKYNMNNMSGDLDIALAYDPRILKYFKTAASDAWTNKKGGPMSRDMREAIEYGVVGSGFSIQEIPDVKDIGIFKVLMGNDSNIIARYWEQTKELTQARENILRIAAYKYFKDQLATGKKLYGVSKKELVDAERDLKRKAAMLARDLVGDYGNISKAGQWLREHMIPFWSWMEINTPRYLRLMRNASLEGKIGETTARTGVVLTRKAAFKTGKVILQANILYAGIMAWNAVVQNMVGMTDDEKRSLFGNNRQLHLVLGRTDDGEIRTLRIQGALSDALDWFALGDWPDVIRDIREGKKTIGDQFKETIISPLNKIINSSHPILKTGLEVMTGKQLWPDITKPRPIRDKAEYVTRLVSLDMPFRYFTGKPTRGGLKDLLGAVTYTSDPSEAAYWTARKMTYDYLEKTGKEIPSADPTSRSNALYYYKQAKRFKDEKAADKYLKEYINLGGNILGIDTSIKRAAPLGAIPMRQREEFLNSLTLEDARQISLAEKWYEKIMTLTDEERDKISMLSEKE